MKIDKSNPQHWKCLLLFFTTTMLALALKPFLKRDRKLILLYGHKFNGNLKSLYERNLIEKDFNYKIVFLTMDAELLALLRDQKIESISATSLASATTIARTSCIVSDHGLHCLSLLLRTNTKFVDVWHGIPFKGFVPNDFKIQHKYDAIFVSSPFLRDMYINRFGFNEDRVFSTGYGRTDKLWLNSEMEKQAIKDRLNIDSSKKVVMYAPTWKQDSQNRSVIPFGDSANTFLLKLDAECSRLNAIGIIRTHLNSALAVNQDFRSLIFAPHSQYPDTEDLLLISDLLICDWSSIAFDYLVLNRPTIFLNIPAPFKNGFSLGANYRFGKKVSSSDELFIALEKYIVSPALYHNEFEEISNHIKSDVYGRLFDGKSAKRYLEIIPKLYL
jgi:Putative glycosyl/glycerophosphate transferases involved in teichoic acid biosynthesis TagF/TagB/EpsJ/RodC